MDGSEGRKGLDKTIEDKEFNEKMKEAIASTSGMRYGVVSSTPFRFIKSLDTCTNPEPEYQEAYDEGKIAGYMIGAGIDLTLVAGVAIGVYKVAEWLSNI